MNTRKKSLILIATIIPAAFMYIGCNTTLKSSVPFGLFSIDKTWAKLVSELLSSFFGN